MGTTFKNRDWTIPRRNHETGKRPNWLGMRFGVEMHRIWNQAHTVAYQDRYMLCLGLVELRLHKFWRGDDDRAPHDHPWWYLTMPFASYREIIPRVEQGRGFSYRAYDRRVVRRWRFNFRPANFQHIVVCRVQEDDHDFRMHEPFWTFVICGRKTREWGFWSQIDTFIHHRDWKP